MSRMADSVKVVALGLLLWCSMAAAIAWLAPYEPATYTPQWRESRVGGVLVLTHITSGVCWLANEDMRGAIHQLFPASPEFCKQVEVK